MNMILYFLFLYGVFLDSIKHILELEVYSYCNAFFFYFHVQLLLVSFSYLHSIFICSLVSIYLKLLLCAYLRNITKESNGDLYFFFFIIY